MLTVAELVTQRNLCKDFIMINSFVINCGIGLMLIENYIAIYQNTKWKIASKPSDKEYLSLHEN